MGSASDEAARAEVKVSADGTAWHDISATVTSLKVIDHDKLTDKAVVVLDDHTSLLVDTSLEGLEVRVQLGWNGEHAWLFEGVITQSRAVTHAEGHRMELTALDFSYRMTRNTPELMTWNSGETLSSVLRSVISRDGYDIAPGQIEPADDVAFTEEQPLHQANENDLQLVQRLARLHNARAFVEFDGTDRSKLSFLPIERIMSADPLGHLSYCRGIGDLLAFDYERVGAGAMEVPATATIDPTSGDPITAEGVPAAPPPPLPPPRTDRRRDTTSGQTTAIERLTELSDQAIRAEARRPEIGTPSDESRAASRVVRDPTRILGFNGKGTATGSVFLRAKGTVTISGIASWAEGPWYVKKVEHLYSLDRVANRTRPSYTTKFEVSR